MGEKMKTEGVAKNKGQKWLKNFLNGSKTHLQEGLRGKKYGL